jgi:SAM-dependent methyltransferase
LTVNWYEDFVLLARQFGVRRALALMPAHLRRVRHFQLACRWSERHLEDDDFDRRHGTDTAAMLFGSRLGAVFNRSGGLVNPYQTVCTRMLREPLDELSIPFEDFVFVDVGCGKGKAMLVASERPFRKLVGVDISETCIRIARKNARSFHRGGADVARYELVTADAEDFVFPTEPMVVFLCNPFGPDVMERVMGNLAASLARAPRRVAVVYLFPFAEDEIHKTGCFAKVPTVASHVAVYATPPVDWVSEDARRGRSCAVSAP